MARRPALFVKLGGSLITDKSKPSAALPEVIERLANETHEALASDPTLRLLLGHGSGSFGHWAAKRYSTRDGVHTADEWLGYARVAAAAAELNGIVAAAFLAADVPVLRLQPSASARCEDGLLHHLDVHPISTALEHGLVPLVYGDVAVDDVRGGTIISTEDIFSYLASQLTPARILLLVGAPGVLDSHGELVSHISPADLPALKQALGASEGVDVTGGMAGKVTAMVELVKLLPQLVVQILPGGEPGVLTTALLDPSQPLGTLITAR